MIDATRPIFVQHDRNLWDTKIPRMISGTTLKILYLTIKRNVVYGNVNIIFN